MIIGKEVTSKFVFKLNLFKSHTTSVHTFPCLKMFVINLRIALILFNIKIWQKIHLTLKIISREVNS